jgi:hypothetical protein
MNDTVIAPTDIRFIKLGEQGRWEKSCIEDGTLRLGYESPHHEASLAGDWETVRDFWLTIREGEHKGGTVTRDINQVKDFYELDSNTLWFTFHNRKLWWCFVQDEVIELEEDKSRIRHTVNGWSCTDLKGREITVQNLDGRVTTVQGFRGTICGLKKELHEYLISKINGATTKDVDDAIVHLAALTESVKRLVQGLWWKDFELLTDLIFSRAGWQRTTELGKTQKSIDLDMLAPVTGRRAYVQVKSKADIATLQTTIEEFEEMEGFDDLFFVVHTADRGIHCFQSDDPRIHIMDLDRLADLVINAGLVQWLINKRS